jgi:hypothetical protein
MSAKVNQAKLLRAKVRELTAENRVLKKQLHDTEVKWKKRSDDKEQQTLHYLNTETRNSISDVTRLKWELLHANRRLQLVESEWKLRLQKKDEQTMHYLHVQTREIARLNSELRKKC